MADIAVVYWSGTGNTEAMAEFVAEGVRSSGSTAVVIRAEDFGPEDVPRYSGIAFGCPSMGEEVLEEEVFEPMFSSVESHLAGKRVGLFGSYGWGDGRWMRDWADRCIADGADLVGDVIANERPNDQESEDCRTLGRMMAS